MRVDPAPVAEIETVARTIAIHIRDNPKYEPRDLILP